ncbi:MAG: lysophospholipid acyltransferase family protein [Croceimicrobium sp.]|nr:1-acyl-sn-glycerol-3-phosphate acyltransferase [Bacteroidota bacterium]
MNLRFRDPFGNSLIIKRVLIFFFGLMAYYRFNVANKTQVSGSKVLKGLDKKNVLFVSNHQTYFADVTGMYQVFCCAKWGVYDRINFPFFVLNPKINIYFIAALETMSAGLLPKLFAYVGSVSIKRTWRSAGKTVDRGVDPRDIKKIFTAMESGWVITFPQGTTTPFVNGRKGTAHIIKETKPIVIPVVVDGFRRAFDKKGLLMKKKGVNLSIRFKEPLEIDYDKDSSEILDQIMDSIEQSDDFNTMKKIEESTELSNV